MFAPVNRRWGINNRSAGLRVPVAVPSLSAPGSAGLAPRSLQRFGNLFVPLPRCEGARSHSLLVLEVRVGAAPLV